MGQTFKVGDRVECIDGYDDSSCGPYTGWTGTVRYFGNPSFAIVTWDGQGVRAEGRDSCDIDRLRPIETSPTLEARIAALEAEVKALKQGQGAEPAQPSQPEYAFGNPVEVRYHGQWADGFIAECEPRGVTWSCMFLHHDGQGGTCHGFFDPKDIRPRVK